MVGRSDIACVVLLFYAKFKIRHPLPCYENAGPFDGTHLSIVAVDRRSQDHKRQ